MRDAYRRVSIAWWLSRLREAFIVKTCLSGILFESGTIADVVKAAGESGYDAVELRTNERHLPSSTTDEQARSLRRLLDSYSLKVACIASFTGSYNSKDDDACAADLEELRRFAGLAHVLDCDLVRLLVGGPASAQASAADWARPIEWLGRAASVAAAEGVTAVIEIHNNDLVDDVASSLRVMQEVGSDHLGLIFEPANMFICGKEYREQAVTALAKHIAHVHVKDAIVLPAEESAQGLPFRIMPLGLGQMDYLSVFRGLQSISYLGYVCVELAESASAGLAPRYLARREVAAVRKLMDLTL